MSPTLIKLVATDVDGTITESRETYRLHIKAIRAIRRLEKRGIKVALISSNALPIVVGVANYIGATGPTVGESGALVLYKSKLCRLTKLSAREAANLVLSQFGKWLEDRWHNIFRFHDFALRVKEGCDPGELVSRVREFLKSRGIDYVKVSFSGYALHLTPRDVNKGKALTRACEFVGVSPREVLAIGDSEMDVPLLKASGVGVATAGADPALKEVADYVTRSDCGEGFHEICEMILSGDLTIRR